MPFYIWSEIFSYKNIRILRKHIREIHSVANEQVSCNKCGKVFPNKRRLLCHTSCRPFKHFCSQCDYKTKVKKNLVEHIAVKHTQEVLYNCLFCGRDYNYSKHLYEHLNKHHPLEWAQKKAENLEKRRNIQI